MPPITVFLVTDNKDLDNLKKQDFDKIDVVGIVGWNDKVEIFKSLTSTRSVIDPDEFISLLMECQSLKNQKYIPYNVTFKVYHTKLLSRKGAEDFIKQHNQYKGGYWVLKTEHEYKTDTAKSKDFDLKSEYTFNEWDTIIVPKVKNGEIKDITRLIEPVGFAMFGQSTVVYIEYKGIQYEVTAWYRKKRITITKYNDIKKT